MATLLVVDDERAITALIQAVLQNQGYRVFTAPSGERALAQVSHVHPDLILSDVMMPGMDGYALLAAVKHMDPHMRVILLYSAPLMYPAAQQVDATLAKPFALDVLLSRVASMLADTQ